MSAARAGVYPKIRNVADFGSPVGIAGFAPELVEDEDGEKQQQRDPHDHRSPDAEDLESDPSDGRSAGALRVSRPQQII